VTFNLYTVDCITLRTTDSSVVNITLSNSRWPMMDVRVKCFTNSRSPTAAGRSPSVNSLPDHMRPPPLQMAQ
jgi:hypothetical protein